MTVASQLAVRSALVTFVAALALAVSATGQTAPLRSHDVAVRVNSGYVENTGSEPEVVFAQTVQVPEATWLRLSFDQVELAGDPNGDTGSYLVITSLRDGEYQLLNAISVAQWHHTSAYFNGDTVFIELVAYPGTGPNLLALSRVAAGDPGTSDDRSICGPADDRLPTDEHREARLLPAGCSGWLINDCNHCLLTAGHCSGNNVAEFHVPLSNANGSLNHPGPKDQYSFDSASVQGNGGQGVGNDWMYFGCYPNSNTGLTPYEAQLGAFNCTNPPPVGDVNIRITGYGTVSPPIPLTWNQINKTHVGPLVTSNGTTVQYRTDTTGGNSGSPIIWEQTGQAVGIHTHGGCTSGGGQNSGTGYNHTGLQAALANPRGVCLTTVSLRVTPALDLHPWGPVGGPFDPGSLSYELRNTGRTVLDYQVTATEPWTALTNASGTLTGNAAVTVTASINPSANSLGQGVYNATLNFVNTTNHAGDTTRAVVLHVGGPTKIYGWNMDTNPGWTVQGQWAWGTPTGGGGEHGYADPTSGHTGTNVLGYNLAGDYDDNVSETHVTTTAIDCRPLSQVSLHFWRWLGVERSDSDHAYVRVSNDGTTWNTIWQNPNTQTIDNQWVFQDFDLSTYADGQPAVYVRWTMGATDSTWKYCGWNIDDVEIWGVPASAKPGDLNCDGLVDFADIDPFVLALSDQAAYEAQYPNCRWLNADCNNDGAVDFGDIDPFVALLTG